MGPARVSIQTADGRTVDLGATEVKIELAQKTWQPPENFEARDLLLRRVRLVANGRLGRLGTVHGVNIYMYPRRDARLLVILDGPDGERPVPDHLLVAAVRLGMDAVEFVEDDFSGPAQGGQNGKDEKGIEARRAAGLIGPAGGSVA